VTAHDLKPTLPGRTLGASALHQRVVMPNVRSRRVRSFLGALILSLSGVASAQDANDEIYGDGFEILFSLTISNFEAWCTISVDASPYAAAIPTSSYRIGTVVDLSAQPATMEFVWGYWTGTDGDTGPSHDHNQNTTVTMTADKSVLACCPFSGSTTCSM
jgi:hypothetical protein